MSTPIPGIDRTRYRTDAVYKRTVDREKAWGRIADQFEAMAYRHRVHAWLTGSQLGDTDKAGTYIVTGRTIGEATLTMTDGTTRIIYAPVPFA